MMRLLTGRRRRAAAAGPAAVLGHLPAQPPLVGATAEHAAAGP